ncbi:PREDICTED: pentatricopeptide repeat-containing protein At1g31920-like [Nelumbo nucifera]|uniref:Pentatricopeptide repeat-containing protein At1g31920-like n=1 Tax=Nelumbo nucifera TaxID=4432 RepID=A0A1U8BC27_NELNU|nr:PREDICTED: pentatricopeptide repeat-containing protein At1g31920-like [Nelumbo nucifera]
MVCNRSFATSIGDPWKHNRGVCSHASLFENGRMLFNYIAEHDMQPGVEHYSCLDNLLGRTGLCKLGLLQELDLSSVGNFHHSCLKSLRSLWLLDLSNNQLEGSIDTSILTTPTSLEYLFLSNNYLKGSFSFSLANHSKLEVFQSINNKLVVETEYSTWVPAFQLKSLVLSSFTFKNGAIPSFMYHHNMN